MGDIFTYTTYSHSATMSTSGTSCKPYSPAAFEINIRTRSDVLPPTTEAAVRAETAARAEVRAGCHADDNHNEFRDALHANYIQLWQETRNTKAGAVNSQADVVERTLGDTLDCVRHIITTYQVSH